MSIYKSQVLLDNRGNMYLQHLFLLSIVLLVQSTWVQYYVSNSALEPTNGTCVVQGTILMPCLKIEDIPGLLQYNSTIKKKSVVTLLLGNFSIYKNLSFFFHSFLEVHLESWKKQGQVNVICSSRSFSLLYDTTKIITIDSINFCYYSEVAPPVSIHDAHHVIISNSSFLSSLKGFVKINGFVKQLDIHNSLFHQCSNEYAVYICSKYSSISLRNSSFNNNSEGSL